MGVSGRADDRHDHYFKKAREAGYRARSIYKLQEIQSSMHLIRKGQAVLDLGAAPGSWSQLAAELVGPTGQVIAVDRTAIQPGLPPQVQVWQQDVLQITPDQLQARLGLSGIDVVISDMAPNTSGIRGVDHARSVALCRVALEVARRVLRPAGHFVCKVFQGDEVHALVDEVKACFEDARILKPKSSRSESVEIFVAGRRFLESARLEASAEDASRPRWNPLDDG